MSRDGSGNYTLPVGNPVVSGTIIDVNWANPTMADIAQQLNNVVTRDGTLGPLVPIGTVDGTQALPGMSFKLAPGTGLWREAAKAGYSYNGVAAWYKDATGLVVPGNITVNSVNGGPLAGFRNRIINGGFNVWQRGTSGFSNNTYSADRWYTDSGTSVTRSTDVPPGFAYSLKHTGVATDAVHRHYIELSATGMQGEYYDGATFAFSCWCKTSVAGKTLMLYAAFVTAAAGGPIRSVLSLGIGTTSSSWARYTCTFTIPTGASIATAKCLEITSYINTPNCDVYITGVQLESGSVATPFEFRPYSVELALCQRYYRVNKGASGSWNEVTNTTFYVGADSYYDMRATPTPTLINGTEIITRPGVASYNASAVSISDYVMAFTTNAAVVGVPGYLRAGYVALSAEL